MLARNNTSLNLAFGPILIISLFANLQPWGGNYLPLALSSMVTLACLTQASPFLFWGVGLVCDLSIGTPLGFHSVLLLLSLLVSSQLQSLSFLSLLLLAQGFSLLGTLLLSFFGYPVTLDLLGVTVLGAGASAALTIWLYR